MRLDGVPGSQVLTGALKLPILVGRPQAVPCGPGNADVVPGVVLQAQGQLGHLDTDSPAPGERSQGLRLEQWGKETRVLPSRDRPKAWPSPSSQPSAFPTTLSSLPDLTRQLHADHKGLVGAGLVFFVSR